MKRLWGLLFGETLADRARREAKKVHDQRQAERWAERKKHYEDAVAAAARRGAFRYDVTEDSGLFYPGEPGYRWARSQGFRVGLDGYGHGYMGSWPSIRWD